MKQFASARLRKLSRFAPAAVSVAILAFILRRLDTAALGRVLGDANPFWMLAACGSFGLAFVAAAARWHLALGMSRCQVHAFSTTRTVLIGHLFNTALLGPAGGDIAKATLYARQFGFPTSTILATCVVDRMFGGIGFVLFAAGAPGLLASRGHIAERIQALGSARALLWGGMALLLLTAAHWIRRRLKWPSPWMRFARALAANGGKLIRQPRLLGRGVLLAVLAHVLISLVFLFSLKAVTQAPVSWTAIFWVFPVISMVTAAPVTFAGAGLREGAALVLLGQYGIPAADIVAASLLVLVTYLAWALIGAALLSRAPGSFSQNFLQNREGQAGDRAVPPHRIDHQPDPAV